MIWVVVVKGNEIKPHSHLSQEPNVETTTCIVQI